MANEINISLNLQCKNGTYLDAQRVSGNYNQNAIGAQAQIYTVPTTATVIPFPQVATYGYLFAQNYDATNFITFGPQVSGAFQAFCKLKAGEAALVRLNPGTVLMAKADTAAVETYFWLLED